MSDESPQDRHMRELWQGQQTEGVHMSVEQIRASAGKFQRRIQGRNLREYIAAAVVAVFFGFEFGRTDDPLARTGFGLVIAGMCYLVWHLHTNGSSSSLPEDVGISTCIQFQRRELVRQRDLLTGVWRWYLGPLIPGLAAVGLTPLAKDSHSELYRLPAAAPFYSTALASCVISQAAVDHVSVNCPRATTLTRLELSMPGWTAHVNGSSTNITSDNGLTETIALPAGASTVTYSFLPPHEELAALLAAISFLVMAATWVPRRFTRRHKNSDEPNPQESDETAPLDETPSTVDVNTDASIEAVNSAPAG